MNDGAQKNPNPKLGQKKSNMTLSQKLDEIFDRNPVSRFGMERGMEPISGSGGSDDYLIRDLLSNCLASSDEELKNRALQMLATGLNEQKSNTHHLFTVHNRLERRINEHEKIIAALVQHIQESEESSPESEPNFDDFDGPEKV